MADEGNGNGRISVSEDKLRGILAEFKLELFEKLEQYATTRALDALAAQLHIAVASLSARMNDIELSQARKQGGDDKEQQISGRQIAWGSALVAVLSAGLTVLFTHH